ncbi:hypothetical protein [Woodsholea maritima]|uniref:hypothetical protein n=1 Tax=Woodsholea maritima TaxID=240237 RepID=UPI001F332254|nr:hypothetical protein [Woodsholea maritima]
MAAELPGKLIFSVESDPVWARNLNHYLDTVDFSSPAVVYYADIGPVGKWGRPQDSSHWEKFIRYSRDIWNEKFFRHPDVVLIDGRFRPACFAVTRLNISRPVTVLFDDYANRKTYHAVEEVVGPPAIMIGRMARFELTPEALDKTQKDRLQDFLFHATYARDSSKDRYNKAL